MNHPVRGRINAALLQAIDGAMHRLYGARKSRLFAGAPPCVVEIGPGPGANLRYLAPGTRLVAVEPNERMHPALRAKARRLGVELELRPDAAEAMSLPAASVDFVCCSLVLCSVEDPARAIGEVKRILRPGGLFVCIEHVAAPADTFEARTQRALEKAWRWCFEGCNLRRDTTSLLLSAGFERVEVEPFRVNVAPAPVTHHIQGVCVR